MSFHPLLARQLQRLEIVVENLPPEWAELLSRVSLVYTNADQERYRLERAIRTCSDELNELNDTLSAEHSKLQTIVASVGEAFCVLDSQERLVFANREATRLLGDGRTSLVGESMSQFLVAGEIGAAMTMAGAHGGFRSEDFRMKRSQGEVIDVALSMRPLPQEAGAGDEATVLVFSDISERKLAENALRASESRFRAIFEMAAIGMMRAALDGTIEDCNEAYASMLGFTRQELRGKRWTELVVLSDRDRAAASGHDEARSAKSVERRYIRRDGSMVWTIDHASRVSGANGDAFNVMMVQDITEKRQLEVTLRHAQKLEAVGRLAAGVAHEINTPIQFVAHNLAFLQQSFAALGDLHRKARDMVAPSQRPELERLESAHDAEYLAAEVPKAIVEALEGTTSVSQIVAAMKVFAHQGDSETQALADINAALRSVVAVARNETKYVADVVLDLGDVPPVMAFSGDLNQVFLNLIVNATHAIADAPSKGRGTITIATRRDGENVIVTVEDTGTGIPASIRDRVFDPFFTTKEVGRGSGQGLALARAVVVDRHRGGLTFDTTEGCGTTFRVRLPIEGRQGLGEAAE